MSESPAIVCVTCGHDTPVSDIIVESGMPVCMSCHVTALSEAYANKLLETAQAPKKIVSINKNLPPITNPGALGPSEREKKGQWCCAGCNKTDDQENMRRMWPVIWGLTCWDREITFHPGGKCEVAAREIANSR